VISTLLGPALEHRSATGLAFLEIVAEDEDAWEELEDISEKLAPDVLLEAIRIVKDHGYTPPKRT